MSRILRVVNLIMKPPGTSVSVDLYQKYFTPNTKEFAVYGR